MWFVFVAGGLFALTIMVYILFMVFLPEWVGITGKKAIENSKSHAGDKAAVSSISDTLDAADIDRKRKTTHES